MATYESYKDSGVKWLGQIPSHWEVKKLRAFFSEVCDVNSALKVRNQLQFKYGTIVPKPDSGIDETVLKTISKYTVVYPGDIIINGLNLNYDFISFRVGKVNESGVITSAYIAMRPNSGLSPKFYEYMLKAMDAKKVFHGFGTGIRSTLSFKELKHKLLPLVPLEEQEAIVAYLDKVMAEIDRAIEAQQKMIDALNERKQIIITRAVTRGLNPDAPLRDSGIDWLGQIPEHWKVMKLGSLGVTSNGISNDASYFGEGYPFVSYSDVYKNFSLPNEIRQLAKSSERDQMFFSVKRGDVFFTRTSETVDEIGFSSVCLKTIPQAVFAGFLIRFRPIENIIVPEFSKFYFRASCHRNYFVKEMNLVTRASLSQQLLKGLTVLLPPKSEQISISDYLNFKITSLDNYIETCKKMISLLQERKQVIINEVVTGKKKVI